MSEAVLVASVTGRDVYTHRPLREPSDLGPALSTRLAAYRSIVTIEIARVAPATASIQHYTTTVDGAPPNERSSLRTGPTAIAQEQPRHAAVSQK